MIAFVLSGRYTIRTPVHTHSADVASDMGYMAGRGAAFARSTSHNFTVSTSVEDAAEPRRRRASDAEEAPAPPSPPQRPPRQLSSSAPDPVDEETPFESSTAPPFKAPSLKASKSIGALSGKGSLASAPSNINGIEAAKRVFAAEKKALQGPVDGKALAATDNAEKGEGLVQELSSSGARVIAQLCTNHCTLTAPHPFTLRQAHPEGGPGGRPGVRKGILALHQGLPRACLCAAAGAVERGAVTEGAAGLVAFAMDD